mmetsp:Transcript_174255/g.423911  ORF Transcript_174255/g.423911 Transcript_174255/m.423911 type:complete len:249 (-) Transcript_174255:105-851(-)
MGNAPYSTCGATLARHLHGDEPQAEIQAADDAQVYLNVYDLNEDWLRANNLFRDFLKIGGAFHTGVELYGREWSYGQEGVSSSQPRAHAVHIYRTSVPMGMTSQSRAEVLQFLEQEVMPRWQGGDYDILRRNCCSFADFLCSRLVQKHIPGWVTRFPKVASAASRGFGKVMDFGGSVSNAASNDARNFGRSLSAVSGQSQASVTTVPSPASTSPSSSEPGSPRTPRRGWSDVEPDSSREEDWRPVHWR